MRLLRTHFTSTVSRSVALLMLLMLPLLGWGQGSSSLVISQVYGGGGNANAPVRNDFVELHNVSSGAITITGYVVQYASAGNAFAAPTNSNSVTLSGSIPAGGFYLVNMASGGTVGTVYSGDVTNANINMAVAGGKVVLASSNSTTGITPTSANTIDFVGWGNANDKEGTQTAPAHTNTTSTIRGNACTDTNQNGADFTTGAPAPRNSTPANAVSCAVDNTAPIFASSSPSAGSTTATSFVLSSNINEAGTTYYVVLPSGAAAPTSAQVKAGQNAAGAAAGVSGNFANTANTAATATVTGLTASTDYAVYVVAQDAATTPNLQAAPTLVSVKTSALVPTLGVSAAALTAFSTTTGTPSAAQSYTLTGSNLTADVEVTPPAGYQVSQTSATTGFAADGVAITVARSGTSVSATLYARLTGTNAGTYGTSGTPLNITHVSTTASANKAVYGTVSDPTIGGVTLNPATVCTTSGDGSTSVSFTPAGTFAGTFTVQLSDASGSFAAPLSTATGAGSPIVLTVPQGTATGTGYLVRVLNSSPAVTSSTAALTVVNNPTVTISPATAQSITTDQTVSFSGTETPAANSRQWKYGTSAGSYTTNGGTGLNYTFAPTTPGTYYVVLQSTFAGCGIVTSAPTQVTVASPAPTLTGLAPASAQTGSTTSVTLTGTGFNTASVVNFNGATLTPTFNSTTSLTVSLTAPAATGPYPVTVTNPTPGGGTSGAQTFTVTTGPLLTYKTTGLTGSTGSLAVNTITGNLSASTVTRTGVNPVSTSNAYVSSGFPSGSAPDAAKYLTFSYTPSPGYSVSLTSIQLSLSRSGSGATSMEVRASTDNSSSFTNSVLIGTATAIPDNGTPGTQYTLTPTGPALAALQSVTVPVYFRLYGYGGTSNTRVSDPSTTTPAIIVNGTVDVGAPVSEINITQGSTSIASGTGSYAFTPPVLVGSSTAAAQFNIQNTGTLGLKLTDSPIVAVSGDVVDFTLTQPTAATVAANSSLPFTIAFNPTSTGTKTITISIANDDSDENPYTFTVTGTGVVAPVVTSFAPATGPVGTAVTITGTDFTAGSTVSFNGTAATAVTFNSVTSLTATVPTAATTGPITVATAYGSSTSANSFTVTVTPTAGLLLLEENFAYPVGQPITSNSWTAYGATSTGTAPTTVAGNLTAPQYPRGFSQSELASFAGSASATLTLTGEQDVSRPIGTTTSTTLYAAALINVSASDDAGDYFLTFTNAATNSFRGRVYIQRVGTAAAGTFQLGVSASASAGTYTTGTPYNSGTPYLVVVKYTGSGNTQSASLFVFSGAATPTEPATATVSTTVEALATGTAALTNVALRQDKTALTIDGLRVATNWGTAIGRPVYIDETATLRPGSYFSIAVSGALTSLTATGPATVEGTLSLNGGKINTDASSVLTLTATAAGALSGGSATSFVNGPLARATAAGARTTVFPIGNGALYRPLTLAATAQTDAATYTVSQVEGNPGRILSASTTSLPALTRVSTKRFYTVTTSNPSSGFTGNITLTFGADDYINNPGNTSLVIAKRDGGTTGPWENIGRAASNASTGPDNGPGGAASTGTLTSGEFSGFSDFTFGATDDISQVNVLQAVNPLPVELTAFSAQRQADKTVAVKWNTASEKNSARFEVQRSLNGREFATIATVAAQGTSTHATAYSSLDKAAPAAKLYYRLRQVDLDGSAAFSPVVAVTGSSEAAKVLLYPNPAHSRINFTTEVATFYRVLNQLGQPLLHGTTEAGPASIGLETLPTGLYFLELQTAAGRNVQKFEKE